MNLNVWVRTILTVQKYLERVCFSIDACIEKKINASCYVTSKNFAENSAEFLSNWIIGMTNKKVNLINLNVICMDALRGIDRNLAKILALKHFEGMQARDIIDIMGLSERTYFRRLNNAYIEFEKFLAKHGYTPAFFEKMLEKEGWITEIYYENEKAIKENRKNEFLELSNLFIERVCRAYK